MMKKIISLIILIAFGYICLFAQVNSAAKEVIESYIQDKTGSSHAAISYDIVMNKKDKKSGLWKIHALQKIGGIYYRDGVLTITKGHYNKTAVIDHFEYEGSVNSALNFQPEDALRKSFSHLKMNSEIPVVASRSSDPDQKMSFARNTATASEILVRLMYIMNKDKSSLVLTWETQIHTADRQNYMVTYVEAGSGRILESEDKVLHCSFGGGLVYDASPEEQAQIDAQHHEMHMLAAHNWDQMMEEKEEHCHNDNMETNEARPLMMAPVNSYFVLDLPAEAPNDASATNTQTLVMTAGDPVSSPWGWTSTDNSSQYTYTKGNNVFAFHDPSPGPLGGAPNPATAAQATFSNPLTMQQEFDYPWDLSKEPEYSSVDPMNLFPNRNAAIVNLFYWNNLIHDVFYHFGFDEAGRNFQFDNMLKGGVGNDEVLAQAQDGGGTNNANFLTLSDGVNGQMQMYVWTSSILDLLVQITSVDIPTTVAGGDKFSSIQGALYGPATPQNLYTNPEIDKEYILVNDGCGDPQGCGVTMGVGVPPCNTVTDKIVLINRGTCSFVEKVHGAQLGGAAGVIVMNNNSANPDEIIAMGGSDATVNSINIPAVMVSYNTGVKLKAALAAGAVIVGSLIQDNPPVPKKDGDFDNGIIAHEYGHGISSRLSPQTATGGSLSGSEQGGEGWADFTALYLTTTESDLTPSVDHPNGKLPDRGIGTYVTYTNSDGPGIRPRKYSVDESINEYTYTGDTNGGKGVGNAPEITIPHGVGFIWCTMLWEMTQNFIDEYGFNDDVYYNPPTTGVLATDIMTLQTNTAGNNLAMKLILEGISLQETSPTFEEMRNGILDADTLLYNGAHGCLIWEAFSKRGMGLNAVSGSNAVGDEKDGYANPCDLNQIFYDIEKTAVSVATNQSILSYTLTVTNTSIYNNTGTNIEVMDILPEGVIFLSASGAPFVISNDTITFTIASLAQGVSEILTVDCFVNLPSNSVVNAEYDFEPDEQGWTPLTGGINEFTYETDSGEAHGGENYWFTPNLNLGSSANTTLTSPMLDTGTPNKQIRFWHKFDTDAGYDGGFLETSIDGIDWLRMPLQENGYNGALNSTFNPANAGPAFTGTTVGYIQSAGAIPDDAIQVRFVFSEDAGGGSGVGWWIDDVSIIEGPVSITNVAQVTDPISGGGRTHTSSASTLIIPPLPNHACEQVSLKVDNGVGSLPFAIGCAVSGDTIRFANTLINDTIQLINFQAWVDKNLVFLMNPLDNIHINGKGVSETFNILGGNTVEMIGLHIISGTSLDGSAILNAGNLLLDDVNIYKRSGGMGSEIKIEEGGTITVKSTNIQNE